MDPIGTLLNTAALIRLIARSISLLKAYSSDVIHADENAGTLMGNLLQELESLQKLTELCDRLDSSGDPQLQNGYLGRITGEFKEELMELSVWFERQTHKIKPSRKHSGISEQPLSEPPTRHTCVEEKALSLSQRLMWPLTGKKKVERFMLRVTQYKECVTFALLIIQRRVAITLCFLCPLTPFIANWR